MTKRELVVKISEETGITQVDVAVVIQKMLDKIVDALAAGHSVEFRNFGVFSVRTSRARVGRNPKTPDDKVEIPSRKRVKFKMGRVMKQKVMKDA